MSARRRRHGDGMVTLLCFCCEHRNPAGSRFCNACGTPLHLKPCRHCEAINARAAAHCHSCGETFDVTFEAVDQPEPVAPAEPSSGTPADAPAVAHATRSPVTGRAAVVVAVLAATAAIAAYFAFTDERGAARFAERVDAGAAAGVAPAQAAPALAAPPRRSTAAALRSDRETASAVREPASQLADDGDDQPASPAETADTKPPAPVAVPPAAHEPARRATRAPESRALMAAPVPRATRRESEPARTTARDTQQPPGGHVLMALQRPTATVPRREIVQSSPARAREAAPRTALQDVRGAPCAEGTVPQPGCDFRAMPKGN